MISIVLSIHAFQWFISSPSLVLCYNWQGPIQGSTPMPQWPNGGGGGVEWVVESMTVTHSSADWWDLLLPLA